MRSYGELTRATKSKMSNQVENWRTEGVIRWVKPREAIVVEPNALGDVCRTGISMWPIKL